MVYLNKNQPQSGFTSAKSNTSQWSSGLRQPGCSDNPPFDIHASRRGSASQNRTRRSTAPAVSHCTSPPSLSQSSKGLYQERPRIAHISPLARYPERTQELLAKFFQGETNAKETRELAGRLTFPHDPLGAKLYAEKVRNSKLTKKKQHQLLAKAQFPQNKRAAELVRKVHTTPKLCSFKERITLFAACAYPDNSEDAEALEQRLNKRLAPFQNTAVSSSKRKSELLRFVRDEIYSPVQVVSTHEQLSVFFGLSAAVVRNTLEDPDNGLLPDEHRYREEKQILTGESGKEALSTALLKAVRSFVALENEMHRSGVIDKLSNREQLRQLFSVSREKMSRYVRYLHHEDLLYREHTLGRIDLKKLKKALLDIVRDELQSPEDPLSSNTQLAERFSLSPATVYHILNQKLDRDEWNKRKLLLESDNRRELFLVSPTSFVRAEIEAFEAGQLEKVSTDQELADMFHVDAQSLYDSLSPIGGGLTTDEYKKREFALALLSPQDPASKALRLWHTQYNKERILEHSKRIKAEQVEAEAPGEQKIGIYYNEFRFHSYEEAAVAKILHEYFQWNIEPEVTWQIPLSGGYIDFYIPEYDLLVEWHPIRLFYKNKQGQHGDFDSFEEALSFRDKKNDLQDEFEKGSQEVRDFVEATENQLLQRYRERRQELLKGTPYEKSILIVARSADVLFASLIQPYGSNVPSQQSVFKKFKRALAYVKGRNS